jgi:hypothetical protein
MNTQKYFIAAIAGAVFMYAYGAVVYGILLGDFFAANTPAAMVRPGGDNYMLIALACVLISFILCYVFVQGHENKGVMEGVRFGALMGAFMAASYIIWYATTAIASNVALTSAIADFVLYLGTGAVFGALYKK